MRSDGAGRGDEINGKRTITAGLPRTVKISMVSIFSATAIAASYARPVALNVEPMSLIVFISGLALGPRLGAVVGITSMLVYSNFNPLGPAPIFILLAQVGCMAVVGLVGGFLFRSPSEGKLTVMSSLKMGAAGAYLTILFDLVTNLGFAVSGTANYGDISLVSTYLAVLIYGLPWMVTHVVSNTILFGIAGPVASKYVVKTIRGGAMQP